MSGQSGKRRGTDQREDPQGEPLRPPGAVQAAWAASHKKDSHVSALFRRIRTRRGEQKAIMAVAHQILTIMFHIIRNGSVYQELGASHYDQQNKPKVTRKLVERLQAVLCTRRTRQRRSYEKLSGRYPCSCSKLRILTLPVFLNFDGINFARSCTAMRARNAALYALARAPAFAPFWRLDHGRCHRNRRNRRFNGSQRDVIPEPPVRPCRTQCHPRRSVWTRE